MEDTVPDEQTMRDQLLARVRAQGVATDQRVAAALRAVPRHVFVPDVPPERAYRDEVIVTRYDRDGQPASSSSQPAVMALMLDKLGATRGQRILEIGAGSGFNAALLAHIVGPAGRVVSVDIDADTADTARANLAAAGASGVTVLTADGAHGYPDGGPYDRIIATVGVWDLAPAWLAQLTAEGRIVVPLDLGGVQRVVAFERSGDHWVSRSAAQCGFMRIRGSAAGPERVVVLDGSSVTLLAPHGITIEPRVLAARLATPGPEHRTGVSATAAELFDGVSLWLAVREPRWVSVSEQDVAADPWPDGESGAEPVRTLPPAPFHAQGTAVTAGLVDGAGDRSSAALITARPDRKPGVHQLDVVEYGVDGRPLAERLVALVRAWADAGRPSTAGLRVAAYPRATAPAGGATLDKVHNRFVLSWTE